MKNLNLSSLSAIIFGLAVAVSGAKFAMAEIPVQSSDAEILGVIAVVDQNEIHIAQLAEQKNIDHQVIDYARMLEREHNTNLDHVMKLSQALGISIVPHSPSIDHLRKAGEHDRAILSSLDQYNFSREFISDMIKGHSDVLTWINGQTVQNGQIKRFLDETVKHIAMHLKKAQRIQEQVLR